MKENDFYPFNGFKYSKNGIEYPNTFLKPKHFHKYYAISKNSFESFLESYLFFSHPNQLNDLLDSSVNLLDFNDCNEEWFNYNFKGELDFKEEKKIGFRNVAFFVYTKYLKNIGVLSLTTSPFNNLMMPHYTNEKGFILEFEPEKLIANFKNYYKQNRILKFPINYVNGLKPINFFENIIKYKDANGIYRISEKIPFLYLLSVKDEKWNYEEEWRLILFNEDFYHIQDSVSFPKLENKVQSRKVKFDQKCISRIILGPLFFNNYYFFDEKNIDNVFNSIRVSYKLNIKILADEKLDDLYVKFLEKICEKSFNQKIYIQNLMFDKNKYERFCNRLEDIKFENNEFSFTLSNEIYRFSKL